ncbi:unnamed protein product [Colletotrichum noveboracense]|uniref:Uncharacterized protein n=1 Tax=Colletotrichum noveboracense TaxID=2664923 RepID=A0A9W4WKU3_9PEZI|nr:hypothetical protein K456DRAFT_1907652 [Colletotrichum gloeosporioides 23]CAI0652455.1 unnamed protein product [Colletotrichum noveboracense]
MRYQEWLEVSHPGAAPPRPKPVSTPAPAPTRAQGPHRHPPSGQDRLRPDRLSRTQLLDSSPQHQPRPCRIDINLTSSALSSSISRARRSSMRTLPQTMRIGENFWKTGGIDRGLLRNGERPFEVHFGGEVRELYGENASRDVNRCIDPRLCITRSMRNEKLYLVVYRPRRNEQYSLNVEGLSKAYFEAWVGLRTFRTSLSVELAPSLGDHFKNHYGTLVTELVRVGLELEGEIAAEVHEASEKNENKRQLEALASPLRFAKRTERKYQ